MAFEVEFTDEFGAWWDTCNEDLQDTIVAHVNQLIAKGPALGRPQVDTLHNSKLPNLKELRVQHAGEPYRILFVFDPRRVAILLLGGNKTGDDRWYDENIPQAEKIYADYLDALKDE